MGQSKWTDIDAPRRDQRWRKYQLVQMAACGMYPSEIAKKTGLPVAEVRSHLRWKLGKFQDQCGRVRD